MVLVEPAGGVQRDEAICLVGWLEVLAGIEPVELRAVCCVVIWSIRVSRRCLILLCLNNIVGSILSLSPALASHTDGVGFIELPEFDGLELLVRHQRAGGLLLQQSCQVGALDLAILRWFSLFLIVCSTIQAVQR